MDARLQELLTGIDTLIGALEKEEERLSGTIAEVAPTHQAGAINLVHYSELRRRDIRKIQNDLEQIGATRLSTTEPAVLPRLKAARNVVAAYSGEPLKYGGEEVRNAFAEADDILEEHANILFGASPEETHSRIMVTLPTEASDDLELVRGFVEAGMELARINCAHDGPEAWQRMINNVHVAAEEAGREVYVAMDLAGPKVRTGDIAPGPEVGRARVTRMKSGHVLTPAKLWLTPSGQEIPPIPKLPGRPTMSLQVEADWLSQVEIDSVISLHDNRDSKRQFTVTRVIAGEGGSDVPQAVLAEGQRNAYISNSTLLEHAWLKTRVRGVPAVEQKIRLHAGDRLILTDDQTPANPLPGWAPRISCTLPEAVKAINLGQRVLFDDGSIAGRAVDKQLTEDGHTEVTLDIDYAGVNGTNLAAYKGINLPETELPLPSLMQEDLEALEFVAQHADIANVSFIRDAEDVAFVLDHLERIASEADSEEAAQRTRNLGIVLKIETIPAFENLAQILLEGMRHPKLGIMIARGDLAVELGFERMAEVPRLITQLAEAAHVPVIMATQVLENLAKSGLPTRAEITDAAYALRAEAVMLNKGPHITDAIRILSTLSVKLGRSQRKNRQILRQIGSWVLHPEDAQESQE